MRTRDDDGRMLYPPVVEPYAPTEMSFEWWRGEVNLRTIMDLARAEWHSRMTHQHDNPLHD